MKLSLKTKKAKKKYKKTTTVHMSIYFDYVQDVKYESFSFF